MTVLMGFLHKTSPLIKSTIVKASNSIELPPQASIVSTASTASTPSNDFIQRRPTMTSLLRLRQPVRVGCTIGRAGLGCRNGGSGDRRTFSGARTLQLKESDRGEGVSYPAVLSSINPAASRVPAQTSASPPPYFSPLGDSLTSLHLPNFPSPPSPFAETSRGKEG